MSCGAAGFLTSALCTVNRVIYYKHIFGLFINTEGGVQTIVCGYQQDATHVVKKNCDFSEFQILHCS